MTTSMRPQQEVPIPSTATTTASSGKAQTPSTTGDAPAEATPPLPSLPPPSNPPSPDAKPLPTPPGPTFGSSTDRVPAATRPGTERNPALSNLSPPSVFTPDRKPASDRPAGNSSSLDRKPGSAMIAQGSATHGSGSHGASSSPDSKPGTSDWAPPIPSLPDTS